MQEIKDMKIIIPEGQFEGYCGDYYFGKRKNKDAKGRILCKGQPGGYKEPDEKNECKHYISRVKQWIINFVMAYIFITVVVIILEAMIH